MPVAWSARACPAEQAGFHGFLAVLPRLAGSLMEFNADPQAAARISLMFGLFMGAKLLDQVAANFAGVGLYLSVRRI